ncbi:hypothetical protein RclHR1_33230001 [Rhizophagus clarus]|uniref:Endonuclease/exonuclease/phosphatase domain-containing protein n=1 Tax=Rhizophagus clarus TaxID=94130 RepID=A0A2Z6R8W2_9GLOM|nr:hypothetical protein RclHR1_33230001 [Rhizophagus clarus]
MKWAKHITSMDLTSLYLLSINLLLKKREIFITAIYAAPENKQHIHKKMIDNTMKQLQQNLLGPLWSLHIITGDFNEIVDPALDKSSLSTNNQTASKLH